MRLFEFTRWDESLWLDCMNEYNSLVSPKYEQTELSVFKKIIYDNAFHVKNDTYGCIEMDQAITNSGSVEIISFDFIEAAKEASI